VRKNLLSRFLVSLALALTVSACPILRAQTFSFNHGALQTATLDGLWRFHPGDDPHWADPSLDDSSWPLVHTDKSWPDQGMPVASGSFWYRAQFFVPAGSGPLSLYIPSLHINYQVFVDGKLVGGQGAITPPPRPLHTAVAVFPLSEGAFSHAHTATIAIRAWRYPLWSQVYKYGLEPGMLAGDTRLIQQTLLLNTRELSWNSVSTIFLTLLEVLAGLAALALFKVRSHEREYLWFGVAMLLSAIDHSMTTYRLFHALDVLRFNLIQNFFAYPILFALIGFYRHLMDTKRDWFYWAVVATLSADFLLNVAGFTPWALSQSWLLPVWVPSVLILTVPFYAWILVLLVRKTMEGRIDALLLLVSNAPSLLNLYLGFVVEIAKPALGWKAGAADWFFHTTQWPFPASINDISSFLLMLTMLAILVHRFTCTSRQEDAHQREIEAARIVQQVLIPAAIPDVPGFSIQSVYKPASQVGGDFFQIIPTKTGGVLAIVGDVSGKGLPAAMTVSLLVGTVRTLAHYTQSPGEILAAMNQRMLARTSGGFTTCFVMRIDADGTLTVANAGHLAPYLRGKELQVEGGLPLGLSADSTYNEVTFRLDNHDQLTVVTDGVVEARDAKGELLGFERTAAMSAKAAVEIAEAAQRWGQEDDITVLAITPTVKVEAVPA
jgi:hypothetical protein